MGYSAPFETFMERGQGDEVVLNSKSKLSLDLHHSLARASVKLFRAGGVAYNGRHSNRTGKDT